MRRVGRVRLFELQVRMENPLELVIARVEKDKVLRQVAAVQ